MDAYYTGQVSGDTSNINTPDAGLCMFGDKLMGGQISTETGEETSDEIQRFYYDNMNEYFDCNEIVFVGICKLEVVLNVIQLVVPMNWQMVVLINRLYHIHQLHNLGDEHDELAY